MHWPAREYIEEIAHEAVAMEEQEEFLKAEIESGRLTLGPTRRTPKHLSGSRPGAENAQFLLKFEIVLFGG